MLRLMVIFCIFPALILAQCNYDQKCWFATIGCTLVKGNPFERRAFISCDECMDLCLKRKDGPAPYCCKSIVYDSQWKFCDLYAIQAQTKADFVQYSGRVYLSPSGNCTVKPASIANCPAGQTMLISIFQHSTNPQLSGGNEINADSAEKCGLLCAKNQDDKGNPIQCKAAGFSQGKCVITDKDPGSNSIQNLKPSQDDDAVYFEKKCYPSDQTGNCGAVILDPRHLLVGFNRKTVDAASYDQCLQQCLSAKQNFQFTCNSGQFYPDTQKDNCILNEETALTKPELYTPTEDNNIYFQPECGATQMFFSMKQARAKMYLKDEPSVQNESPRSKPLIKERSEKA
jgi:hypothetical protein